MTTGKGRSSADKHYRVLLNGPDSEANAGQDAFVIQESIGYLLAANGRLIQREMTACLAEHGIAHAHWSIMLALWAGDGITQRDLSRRVAIEQPTLARALSAMEKEKLVRRERGSQDARQMLVFLTDRSTHLRDALIPLALMVQEKATAVLTEAERMILVVILRKMLEGHRRQDSAPGRAI